MPSRRKFYIVVNADITNIVNGIVCTVLSLFSCTFRCTNQYSFDAESKFCNFVTSNPITEKYNHVHSCTRAKNVDSKCCAIHDVGARGERQFFWSRNIGCLQWFWSDFTTTFKNNGTINNPSCCNDSTTVLSKLDDRSDVIFIAVHDHYWEMD